MTFGRNIFKHFYFPLRVKIRKQHDNTIFFHLFPTWFYVIGQLSSGKTQPSWLTGLKFGTPNKDHRIGVNKFVKMVRIAFSSNGGTADWRHQTKTPCLVGRHKEYIKQRESPVPVVAIILKVTVSVVVSGHTAPRAVLTGVIVKPTPAGLDRSIL